jgi:hypothetical protein
MPCQGIPIYTIRPATCQQTVCKNKSTNPATFTCVGSKFVFAEHYITKGVVSKYASGGYVPATTICQMNINPEHIGKAANSTAKYFGL